MNAARTWKRLSLRQTPEDKAELAAVLGVRHPYALAPFAIARAATGWRVAAALNPPPLLDADALMAWDAEPDSDIILIDGKTGAVTLAGDTGSYVVGPAIVRPTVMLFTDGRQFARAWAANRLAHIDRYRAAKVPGLVATDPPDHGLPGAVLAGELARVACWAPLLSAERVQIDNPSLVRSLNGALIRAAGIPTVEAAAPRLQMVA